MIQRLLSQLSLLSGSFRNGLFLGLGLIFLTLIGIPSGESPAIARLAVPLFLLVCLIVAWRLTAQLPLLEVAKQSVVLGLMGGGVLLLFLGIINSWHAEGVDVNSLYFHKMNTYPIHTLSGVPDVELFPNPPKNPITDEYPADKPLRTNPMTLYTSEKYSLVSLGPLHIGGLYGFGLLVILTTLIGGLAHYAFYQVNWEQVRANSQSQNILTTLAGLRHWAVLTSPLWLFIVFWLSVSHNKGDLHILQWKQILNLTSESLIDQVSLQLGFAFLVIIGGILALREAQERPVSLPFVGQLAICTGLVVIMVGLAILRIEQDKVTFVAPSIGGLEEEGHLISALLIVAIGIGLLGLAIRRLPTGNQFEPVLATILTVGLVLMSPLYMDQYQTFVLGRVWLAIMFGAGLNIVLGYAGLLDLGYVAFYAIGAYTFGFLAQESTRVKVSGEHLNTVGWSIVVAMVIAPLFFFIMSNIWHQQQQSAAKAPSKIKHQSRVWDEQPPFLYTLGLLIVGIIVITMVRELLTGLGILQTEAFSSFLITIVVAMIVAAFTGIALGLPVLRLRGDYLAIVTLGFGEIISLFLQNLNDTTGGPQGALGIPGPVSYGTPAPVGNIAMLYLTIVGAILVITISLRLRHSRLGRAWKAMSSDEDIAQAMGINLVNIKLLAFSIGASFAGFAGMIFASRQASIFPNDFSLDVSINVLALVIIGGMGSIPGVVLGGIALVGLPELLRPIESYRVLTFGLLLIVSMIALPRGLMPSPPPALEEEARRLAEAEDSAKESK